MFLWVKKIGRNSRDNWDLQTIEILEKLGENERKMGEGGYSQQHDA